MRTGCLKMQKNVVLKILRNEPSERAIKHQGHMFCSLIKRAPTIDTEPVRHGRWVPKAHRGKIKGAECSECGKFKRSNHMQMLREGYPYCHGCGAKMDLPHPTNEEKEAP